MDGAGADAGELVRDPEARGPRELHRRSVLVAVEEGGSFEAVGDGDGVHGDVGLGGRSEAFEGRILEGELGERKEAGEEHDEKNDVVG